MLLLWLGWMLLLSLDLPAYGEKKNQRTQTDPPLLSASCFSRQQRQTIQIIRNIYSFYSSKHREASFLANAPCGGLICFPWDGGGTVQIKADPLEFTTSTDFLASWANILVKSSACVLQNYVYFQLRFLFMKTYWKVSFWAIFFCTPHPKTGAPLHWFTVLHSGWNWKLLMLRLIVVQQCILKVLDVFFAKS